MKAVVVSINHNQQIASPKDHAEVLATTEGKNKLRTLLKGIIADHRTDLICEESDPCYVSIAQEEAFSHNPRIPWKNINMTAEERLEAGIWEALLYRPQQIDYETYVTIELRIPEDDIREHFFKCEIIKAAEETGAENVLILCGDAHTEALKTKLEGVGCDVETNHDLIAKKNWK